MNINGVLCGTFTSSKSVAMCSGDFKGVTGGHRPPTCIQTKPAKYMCIYNFIIGLQCKCFAHAPVSKLYQF